MKKSLLLAASLAALAGLQTVTAADNAMSFFVTSVGGADGANFGGLAGADAHCQTLATSAGAGAKT